MAMNRTDVERTVAQLSALNERELIEVLGRVFDAFAKKFDAAGEVGDRYSLVWSSFEKGEDKEPDLHFLGVPSQTYLQQPNDEAVDYGGCPTCGVTVACVDKLATCPVCGTTNVECT